MGQTWEFKCRKKSNTRKQHLKDAIPQILYPIKINHSNSFQIWFVEVTEMCNNAKYKWQPFFLVVC